MRFQWFMFRSLSQQSCKLCSKIFKQLWKARESKVCGGLLCFCNRCHFMAHRWGVFRILRCLHLTVSCWLILNRISADVVFKTRISYVVKPTKMYCMRVIFVRVTGYFPPVSGSLPSPWKASALFAENECWVEVRFFDQTASSLKSMRVNRCQWGSKTQLNLSTSPLVSHISIAVRSSASTLMKSVPFSAHTS